MCIFGAFIKFHSDLITFKYVNTRLKIEKVNLTGIGRFSVKDFLICNINVSNFSCLFKKQKRTQRRIKTSTHDHIHFYVTRLQRQFIKICTFPFLDETFLVVNRKTAIII